MNIKTITVTGADDNTKHDDLVKLAEQCPNIEFGILITDSPKKSKRFPSHAWLKELMNHNLPLSLHICGNWVQEILLGNWPSEKLNDIFSHIYHSRFNRYQLNTHGVRHNWNDEFIWMLDLQDINVIFQNDNIHNDLIERCIELELPNINSLFDLSHGDGVLPEQWPSPIEGIFNGYAGGLSPDNVKSELSKISPIIGNAPIWIDAETRLRTDGEFDLNKCREFYDNAHE